MFSHVLRRLRELFDRLGAWLSPAPLPVFIHDPEPQLSRRDPAPAPEKIGIARIEIGGGVGCGRVFLADGRELDGVKSIGATSQLRSLAFAEISVICSSEGSA